MSVVIGLPIIPKVCRTCGDEGEWPGRFSRSVCPRCQKAAA